MSHLSDAFYLKPTPMNSGNISHCQKAPRTSRSGKEEANIFRSFWDPQIYKPHLTLQVMLFFFFYLYYVVVCACFFCFMTCVRMIAIYDNMHTAYTHMQERCFVVYIYTHIHIHTCSFVLFKLNAYRCMIQLMITIWLFSEPCPN